jgi:hypothetical protein
MPDFGPQPKQFSEKDTYVGIVPIGGCIPWAPAIAGSPQPELPMGWEYADGGTVTTAGSPKFGQTKPALMRTVESPGATQGFIRGADTTVTYGGPTAHVSGGTNTHAHNTNSSGSHDHGGNTSSGGDHSHSINVTGNTSSAGAHTHNTQESGPTGNNSVNTAPAAGSVQSAGAHTHSVNVSGNSANAGSHSHIINTNSAGSHNHGINNTSTLPTYVEMAWIIRVL